MENRNASGYATPDEQFLSDNESPTNRSPPQAPPRSAPTNQSPEHNLDFIAKFPGWPKDYFMGIIPSVYLGAVYGQAEYPQYAYTTLPQQTLNVPFPNTVFSPTTPDPLYVASMPWCAYPYGLPLDSVPRARPGLSPSSLPNTGKIKLTTADSRLNSSNLDGLQDGLKEAGSDSFLAVPTPREKAKQSIFSFWGA